MMNKVIGPDVIAIFRLQTNAGTVIKPEPAFSRLFGWNLQPLTSPQPFDTLVIHLPSCISQQSGDPTITVPTVLPGQFDHVGHKPIFIAAAL
jgi:hypothetical protein